MRGCECLKKLEDLTQQELERLYEFIDESILLTTEELAAIEHQIPMTRELFEQCIEHCLQIEAYYRFGKLLEEYSEFSDKYVEEKELSKLDLPSLSKEEAKKMLENIYKSKSNR